MSFIRIGAAAINQTPLDWDGNLKRILEVIREAQRNKVQILCLPELCISGYGCEDAFFSPDVWSRAEQLLAKIAKHCSGITVAIGLPVFFEGNLYNCVAMIQNKKLLGINAKKNLPREGIHYEYRWFHPLRPGEVALIDFAGTRVPFGDLYYRFGSFGVGLEICEEAWGSTSGGAASSDQCSVILCPSASHFAIGKYNIRETLVANASRAMNVFYVYTNLLGCEAGRIIYDGGALFAKGGKIVHRGKRFGFSPWNLSYKDCDLTLVSVSKARSKSVANQDHRVPQAKCVEGSVIAVHKSRSEANNESQKVNWTPENEFLNAAELGLFDYLRKSNSKGYVVSLSGGVDSAVCATLIASAFRRAAKDLKVKDSSISKVLHCIYQSTKQSSAKTFKLAEALAKELGASFHSVDVDYINETYIKLMEGILGRSLTWQKDDLTLQNIQARVRSPMAWLLANTTNSILITTSNRSEGTTGYATMDGDMSGGLAPIAGVDKAFLRRWALWAAESKEIADGPIKALREIAAIPPTAELRPAGAKQEDEKDLMPYDILARMEKLLLRDHMMRAEALLQLKKEFPKRKTIEEDLRRFETLFARSQWKRERMAPSFHLDDFSVDSRSWLRYPILSH